MTYTQPHRVKTISEFHKLRDLSKPEHPLISVINFELIKISPEDGQVSLVNDFYSIYTATHT